MPTEQRLTALPGRLGQPRHSSWSCWLTGRGASEGRPSVLLACAGRCAGPAPSRGPGESGRRASTSTRTGPLRWQPRAGDGAGLNSQEAKALRRDGRGLLGSEPARRRRRTEGLPPPIPQPQSAFPRTRRLRPAPTPSSRCHKEANKNDRTGHRAKRSWHGVRGLRSWARQSREVSPAPHAERAQGQRRPPAPTRGVQKQVSSPLPGGPEASHRSNHAVRATLFTIDSQQKKSPKGLIHPRS